jgi:VIT1/CCC1 family predicted Fe2+/Mn2+ transporter
MHIHTAPYVRELRKKRRQIRLPFGSQKLLAILEGIEGGFAIGAGLVAGLAFATSDRRLLLITALISLLVSGFNSSTVKYASEHYADELDGKEKQNPAKYYLTPAVYEFIAYAVVSVITVLPLLLIDNLLYATFTCITITLVTLFAAGYWRGYLMNRHKKLRDGAELLLLGALIILIGAVSGYSLHNLAL